MQEAWVYHVQKLENEMKIDGNWDKPEWKDINSIEIKNFMGNVPSFRPAVKGKLMYNDDNVFVIYIVEDCFVRCFEQDYNAAVSNDSCVEFFFSPDVNFPERYFNLEVNCGGAALMRHNIIPRMEYTTLGVEDLKQIEIAHSLPSKVYPEIPVPLTWTIEYRIPLELLRKYSNITYPKSGVSWRGNFYKVAEKSSNPHWMTWSFVDVAKPDFHVPQFFGTLTFE
jgi:hypothetical protein